MVIELIKIQEEQKEENNLDNLLYYKGDVKIKILYNNKVIKEINKHNAGVNRLFLGIYYYLIDYNTNNLINYKPNYLIISDSENDLSDSSTSFKSINLKSFLISRKEITNNKCVLVTIIPGITIQNYDIKYLGLFGEGSISDNQTLLAWIGLDEPITNINIKESLIIEWSIDIGNKGENN